MKRNLLIFLVLCIPFFSGCKHFDDLLFQEKGAPQEQMPPTQPANTSGEGVQAPVPPVEKKRDIEPNAKTVQVIRTIGSVLPFPYADAAAGGLAGILSIVATLRNRRKGKELEAYGAALKTAVATAGEFKESLKASNKTEHDAVKERVKRNQEANGTRTLIKKVLSEIF